MMSHTVRETVAIETITIASIFIMKCGQRVTSRVKLLFRGHVHNNGANIGHTVTVLLAL